MKNQIHVVYIITKLELGGAQKVCLSLLNGLKQADCTSILISGKEGVLIEEAKKHSNTILLDSFVREVSYKTFVHEVRTFIHLIKKLHTLKKEYPHLIVHTHSTKAGLLGRWAAFFAGVKKRVHTIHGYGFNDFQPKVVWFAIYFLELVTSLITTHFVCVSQKDAETGKRLFPWFTKKHTLIHAAVDWEIFYQPARKIEDTFIAARKTDDLHFTFGAVACFKKQKNLFDLLNAFKEIHAQYSYAKLELIGDGVLRPAIELWIKHYNLADAIILHGWQPSIEPIMKKWHAFVLTSLWEGLPCAVIEARLLSIPVISYKTGGIPEVIHHNKNGLLYEQKDIAGITEGMRTLIENKQTYQSMCTYHDSLETFKNNVMVEKHIELYKNL